MGRGLLPALAGVFSIEATGSVFEDTDEMSAGFSMPLCSPSLGDADDVVDVVVAEAA